MKQFLLSILLNLLLIPLYSQVTIETDLNSEGISMSQDLIGVFFEDINFAADGGLYAELVENRSFEYYTVSGYVSLGPYTAWSLVERGGASAGMEIQDANPLNKNNTKYLALTISSAGTEAGIQNSGFDGIPVVSVNTYNFSVYLRSAAVFGNEVTVRLESSTGEDLGSVTLSGITTEWTKFSQQITCTQSDESARLVLVTNGTGTLYFDMVSLFPSNTYKNRENGLREDLAQAISDLEPKFLRFPGGCISHGRGLDNAYRWKETIGDVAERTPNWNLWQYHQTYGLGFYEYFLFCEDMGAKPLPVLPVGISCQFRDKEIAPIEDIGSWIQDAVDLVEFANGDTTTNWGKKRADMGHPEPFNLEYICLGNEEDDIPEFRERFSMFVDTLRKYNPEIKIIGTSGTAAEGAYYTSLWEYSREENLDAVDEHYYVEPDWMLNNIHRYDNFPRTGPKVFIGEYASKDDKMANAIAEAAYLTGVERNSDVIQFTCYAPLFNYLGNVNYHWHPDLILFDKNDVVKTASYWVQQLYSKYTGDTYINSDIAYDEDLEIENYDYTGKVGLGSWSTQVEYDSFKVTCGETVLIDENFNSASNWTVASGSFAVSGGVYAQSGTSTPAISVCNTTIDTSVYTLTVKARKTGGDEGFLIPFAYTGSGDFYWFNIGGWANTQHAVEKSTGGTKSQIAIAGGSIESNVWYDIKIEVSPESTRFYIDSEFIFDIPAPAGPIASSVVKNSKTDEVIVKLVNSGDVDLTTNIKIATDTFQTYATQISFEGNSTARNSLSSPDLLVPVMSTHLVSNNFNYTIPANSFHVLVFKTDEVVKPSQIKDIAQKEGVIKIIPNPMEESARIEFKNSDSKKYALNIYDASGKQVFQKTNIKTSYIEISNAILSTGTYIVKLSGEGKVFTEKLLVE